MNPASGQSTSPAQRLRTTMAAVRVSFMWLGVRKTLTAEQKAEAAEPFGANAQFLSAGKKLIDTAHPAFKAVTAIRNRAKQFWASMSLPYPEPGIRLIRQDRIDQFDAKMREFQEELADAVATLDRHYSELKATARQRLGSLFNAGDYPGVAPGHVRGVVGFPSVEPPDYLQQLNPQLYEQECQRVQAAVRRGGASDRGGVYCRTGQAGLASDGAAVRARKMASPRCSETRPSRT